MDSMNFWGTLDALVHNEPVSAPAKEELDATSSTDEFIEEISTHIADFIKTNRHAFDTDDDTAITEYVGVVSVPEIIDKVKEKLVVSDPEEGEVELTETTETEELPAAKDDSEYVSDDVMALLDA